MKLNRIGGGTLLAQINRSLRSNSPTILTVSGCLGVIATAVLTAKASFSAKAQIDAADEPLETWQEKVLLVWPLYVPSITVGTVTIASVVQSNRLNNRRLGAAVAAYSIADKALAEYRAKVVEQIGERREQNVRDEIAADKVRSNPPGSSTYIASGNTLCCELYTGRYFECNMETLKRAEIEIVARSLHELYVTLDEFYDLIGLEHTQNSSELGWDSDLLMKLEFSAVLHNDRPVLAFQYSYIKPI